MKSNRLRYDRVILVGCYGAALVAMWGLKQHYSKATAEGLAWVLRPVAALVQLLDGQSYSFSPGTGWVRWDGFIVIAPACAGVNFMIMLFGLSVAAFLHHFRGIGQRLGWLLGAAAGAYLVTLWVNCMRIMLSIVCYERHLAWGWLSPERIHRATGVAIYSAVLWLCYMILDRIIKRMNYPADTNVGRLPLRSWIPLAWYLIGAVAVPFVHKACGGDPQLDPEYVLTVLGVSLLVWGVGLIIIRSIHKESPCDLLS